MNPSFIWRLPYRLYRFYSGLRYRLGRRFTRAGQAVLAALIIAGIMGTDTDNNLAYQAFALLTGLVLVAVSFRWFFRARFSVERLLPRFGTVGQPFSYRVLVMNLTDKRQGGLTVLEDLADARPAFHEWLAVQLDNERQSRSFRVMRRRRLNPFRTAALKEAALPPAPPNEEAEATIELTPLRRGVLRFTGVTLARPDPLGLYRAFATVPLAQTALILPRRYPVPPIALPGTLKYQEGGIALAANVGRSDEFVSLRDYRRGDPLRHIHWRSWAKAGKPVIKEFEDEFFVRHALVLDTFTQFAQSEVFEEAVSVAASFACTLRTQESLLDLLFVGPQSYCFTAGRGLAHADQMLEILASVRPCRDQQFGVLERLVLNHVKAVSGCISLLLSWDQARRKFIEKLQALGVPVIVLVIVPAGQSKPLDAGPMQETPERFAILEAGQIEAGLARLR